MAKRSFDLVTAVALLVALSPALVLLAVAIKLDSRGPVLYRARRVGHGGREFAMLKFRKMRSDATGPRLTVLDDDRFTRLGRFLAQSKLDELPQLWNVVRGEMSLVGPRPESPEFVSLYRERYRRILQVKPGITGLCQLAYAKEAVILDAANRVADYTGRVLPQKMALDEFYAARRSLLGDLRILLWTAVTVLSRLDVAVHRRTGKLSIRRRKVVRPAGEAGVS